MFRSFAHAGRIGLAVALIFLSCLPAYADITIFSPFNIGEAMDDGSEKIADVRYADGDRHTLDIYKPKDLVGTAPVVMFIYGGSWRAGTKFEYEFVGRAFAAAGFIAVIPDYRLYPTVRYPDFLEDNGAAVRWIQDNIAKYGGDPTRFFLSGHSAGAYNAVMLGLDHSFLHDNGVEMPVRAIAAISGPYNFYPFEYNEVRDTFGQALNPEGTQPVNLVNPDVPPMLLASGTADPIVRVENSKALAAKLRAQGLWVTEKYYDGFGHLEPVIALGKLMRFRMPILADIVDFFQTFGAFPSGTSRPFFTPNPPEGKPDPMIAVAKQMDDILMPIENGHRAEE